MTTNYDLFELKLWVVPDDKNQIGSNYIGFVSTIVAIFNGNEYHVEYHF